MSQALQLSRAFSIRSNSLRTIAFFCASFFPLLAGCGGDPFPYDHVSGTIRYADGTAIPFHRLLVTFNPQSDSIDAKTHPRAAQAVVLADGSFDIVTTLQYGDGAVRGKHNVTIIALDENEAPSKLIPEKYHSVTTTPLEFDTRQSPWTIKIDRPAK